MNSTTLYSFSILSSPHHDPTKFHNDMKAVFYGTFVWIFLFAIIRLYPYGGGSKGKQWGMGLDKSERDMRNRIVSFIHGLFAIGYSTYHKNMSYPP